MKILLVGGGGREHALAWKIAASPLVDRVFCAPGNAGIGEIAECIPIKATDIDGLVTFAVDNAIDLTVVGPEAPLAVGIVDRFESRGLRIFGPSTDPARIESSKIFSKQLMRASNIPTARFWACESVSDAQARVKEYYTENSPETRIVIKADGLAAGKGVTVASGEEEALQALDKMMIERVFGAAGENVLIEECLYGEEASIMAITDGQTVLPLVPAQDHKRIFDGDRGPNTGGMGAYCPVPSVTPDLANEAVERILKPAIAGIRDLGIPYRGVLYAGIMLTESGIQTIEFNCRLGDPETQAVLPLIEGDLVPVLIAATECALDQVEIQTTSGSAVCVVAASRGYPETSTSGCEITGLEAAAALEGCLVFHSGTRRVGDRVVTDGGRVLSVTGLGADIEHATARAYTGMAMIQFEGMQFRHDIAARALHRG